ncbi:hypothetical protein Tco_0700074 [Tanacetum coccineum]
MESLNSNSKEREMQLTQRLVKQRHSHCMAWFEQLEAHLRDLYLNSSPHVITATVTRCSYKSVQAMDDSFDDLRKASWKELENINPTENKTVNKTQLQQHESLSDRKVQHRRLNFELWHLKHLDVCSFLLESSETKSDMHDTSNSSRTYITHVVDANIRPVNDQVPSAEVHLTVPHNVLATEQYQAKSPLLKAELVKSKEMIEKETYNELSRSKTVENADLKAQIQEKVFANAALKNKLRKLKRK